MVAIFQSWRLRLREVEAALKVGRLDEAFQMLTSSGLLEYLPAKRLAAQLSLSFAERAKRRARAGEYAAGWKDLDSALRLVDLPACDVARNCLVEAALKDIEEQIGRGALAEAAAQLDVLEERAKSNPLARHLRELVRALHSARSLSRRGKFGDAESHLDAAQALRPDLPGLAALREECRLHQKQLREWTEQLYRATQAEDHAEAVLLAEQMLEIAPEMKLARAARQRASTQLRASGEDPFQETTILPRRSPLEQTMLPKTEKDDSRFLLWVDGVGGYLVCLADEILLGQATSGNRVDVPIVGDLSRQHLKIRRAGEGYVLDPLHELKINGRSVRHSTALCNGDELEFGAGLRYRFRRPHALSASARLDPISHHRTQPSTDAVILMAESCVLGPGPHNHIVCRDWSADVVLSQRDGVLACRSLAPLEIDGQLHEGRGSISLQSRILGADFSMSLEELDRCSRQPLV